MPTKTPSPTHTPTRTKIPAPTKILTPTHTPTKIPAPTRTPTATPTRSGPVGGSGNSPTPATTPRPQAYRVVALAERYQGVASPTPYLPPPATATATDVIELVARPADPKANEAGISSIFLAALLLIGIGGFVITIIILIRSRTQPAADEP
jgi:hypothetical protein